MAGSCGLPCERKGGKGKGEGEIYHLCFGPPSTEKVRITLLPVSSASPSNFSRTTSRDGIPPCTPLPPSRPFPPLVSTPPQPPTNAISTRIFPSLSSATCPRVKRCQPSQTPPTRTPPYTTRHPGPLNFSTSGGGKPPLLDTLHPFSPSSSPPLLCCLGVVFLWPRARPPADREAGICRPSRGRADHTRIPHLPSPLYRACRHAWDASASPCSTYRASTSGG